MVTKSFRGMHPFSQLVFSVFVILVTFIVFFLAAMLLAIAFFGLDAIVNQFTNLDYNNPETIVILKYMQTVQSLGLFVLPPIIIARMFSDSIAEYLKLNWNFNKTLVLISFLIIVIANPAINFLGSINEGMSLPDWLSGMEEQMKQMEENAALILNKFIDVKTTGGLLFNLLMIAVLPAFGEEFLFRGVLQRILSKWSKNYHWGIWITAILFSAMHMQFYGFIPRMLLGAIFGYMLVWSGSLWIPILAHFFNNAVGVLALHFINKGTIDPKVEDIGSGQLPMALLSLALSSLLLYYFYKQRTDSIAAEFDKAPAVEIDN
jgi:membrane protease YdiL (CAAX protease family)